MINDPSELVDLYVIHHALLDVRGDRPDLNRHLHASQAWAFPIKLRPPLIEQKLVWVVRFELTTSPFQAENSGQAELHPD